MSYAPYEQLIAPARPRAQLWRLILGTLLAVFVMISLSRALFTLARSGLSPADYADLIARIDRADTPLGLLILLCAMGVMGLGAIIAARLMHDRGARTLFGPGTIPQFLRVTIALIALNLAVALLPPWDMFTGVTPGLPIGLWTALLPLSLLALLVQTGAEELFFRGYLQSQLAARFTHPLIWLTVPSALFALGHHAPNLFGANAWLVTFWAFAFGLAMADLTARAGSLGPAIAVHFVNNTSAILLVSMQGDMSGLALFHLPFDATDSAQIRAFLPLDVAMIALSWLTARLALRV